MKFDFFIKKLNFYFYPIMAFILPFFIRLIPEIIAWPYPIGFDPINWYIPAMLNGECLNLMPLQFLKSTYLYYLLITVTYFYILHDPLIILKIYGVLLHAFLTLMIYFYLKKIHKWKEYKAIFTAIFSTTYFVSLRISWEMHRQMLGSIFLISALIMLNNYLYIKKKNLEFLMLLILSIVIILSHELIAVLLLFLLSIKLLKLLLKRDNKSNLYSLLIIISISSILFLYQRYDLQSGTFEIPHWDLSYKNTLEFTSEVMGFITYCYILILPLSLIGMYFLKDENLKYWTILCLIIPTFSMIYPSMSISIWYRWIIMLIYPLSIYFIQGISMVLSFFKNKKYKIIIKTLTFIYILILFLLSMYYLTTYPENSHPYFSQYNPYLIYIPSSMLQSAISIKDVPATIECIKWLNKNMGEKSKLIVHECFYGFVKLYLEPGKNYLLIRKFKITKEDERIMMDIIIEKSKQEIENGYKEIYFLWWKKEYGWYNIPTLPSNYEEKYTAGNIAIYIFKP